MNARRKPIKLTKKRAALLQIEAAITHMRAGRWAEAVTLAGAAEHCLPALEGAGVKMLIAKGLERIADEDDLGREAIARGIVTKNDIVRVVNQTRDWLKHWNADQPDEWEVEADDALFMIFRAVTVYDGNDGRNSSSLDWFRNFTRKRLKELMANAG
ncbi:MAG: hypothetical protein LCH56_03405 [Proteobacteria bacterium]|nr:hypothetical protein [Pseudomonadota bacterium]